MGVKKMIKISSLMYSFNHPATTASSFFYITKTLRLSTVQTALEPYKQHYLMKHTMFTCHEVLFTLLLIFKLIKRSTYCIMLSCTQWNSICNLPKYSEF